MKEIKIQAPAKINLTLDVICRRYDGFHDLKSIMHAISLYDYLTFKLEDGEGLSVELSGNSDEIPYDEHNLVYKAAVKFFEAAGVQNAKLYVYIEKNIPVAAGLAGGSTDAAATLYGLNRLYDRVLSKDKINELCASLGSDLNFCIKGGCAICTSRGEEVRPIPFLELPISIVKPRNLKISAREAFEEYDNYENKRYTNSTDALTGLIVCGHFDHSFVHNDLEAPIVRKYSSLANIKCNLENSFMSGSGPVFYTFTDELSVNFEPDEFIFAEHLRTIGHGVKVVR